MNLKKMFKTIFCRHEWEFHGWGYVKCSKCAKVEDNPALNAELQRAFWEKRVIEGHPIFGREAINRAIISKGRSTHLISTTTKKVP